MLLKKMTQTESVGPFSLASEQFSVHALYEHFILTFKAYERN